MHLIFDLLSTKILEVAIHLISIRIRRNKKRIRINNDQLNESNLDGVSSVAW